MTYWFTSDEHYYHKNIIQYCSRPFKNIEEMNKTLIDNHNSVVRENDIVIHGGDFCLIKNREFIYKNIINKLKGKHIFISGSHDYWLNGKKVDQIWERKITVKGVKYHIVVCHYAMHTWPRSHYGSYHLFGHSHGGLKLDGKRHDTGVDNNNYFPISDEQVIEIMSKKGENPNKVSTL